MTMVLRFARRTLTIQVVAMVYAFLLLTLILLFVIWLVGSLCMIGALPYCLYSAIVPLTLLALLCLCLHKVFKTLLNIDLNSVKGMCFAELMMHISILLGNIGFFIGLGSAR